MRIWSLGCARILDLVFALAVRAGRTGLAYHRVSFAGDKLSNLEAAIDMLDELAGHVQETSRLYCTAPQYVEDQPSFFNLVLKLTTTLSPEALLEAFKRIEREIGRVQSFR